MAKNTLKLVAIFVLGTMILCEVTYAQVGLAVMGARRAKKQLEKQQQAREQQQTKQQQAKGQEETKGEKAAEHKNATSSSTDEAAQKLEVVKGEGE